jgi:hypothetical protein
MREAEPFVDAILRVRAMESPTYELTAEGLRLVSDGLTDNSRKTIRECESGIAEIWAKAEARARLLHGI